MSYKTKQERRDKWKDLNFLGTIDWAVDLQDFSPDGPSTGHNESSCVNVFDNMIWNWVNPVIEGPVGCTNLIQASPLPTTVTRTAYTTATLVSGNSLSTTVVSTVFPISEVNYQPFTIASSDTESGSVLTYNPVPRVTPDPMGIQIPQGWTITSTDGPVGGSTSNSQSATSSPVSTTTDGGAGMVYITWKPTVSYNLPSYISPKLPAPTKIPEDEDSPNPPPKPGVEDCKGDGCTEGQDCTDDDCTRGGDCIGPGCTHGGNCKGPSCIRGGMCSGKSCEEGGDCSGDNCVQGGGCSGPKCNSGGGCSGSNCNRGGDCVNTIFNNCSPGDCIGASCIDIDCTGPWCDNQITISVQSASPPPTPKPTCLVNCPTLPPSPTNKPCNIAKCPPDSMPTAKGCTSMTTANACTEIISSTTVQKTPTTSHSTTTRTRCEKLIDCNVQDTTRTTTMTTSGEADPTASPTGIYDYVNTMSCDPRLFSAIVGDYDAWESLKDVAPSSTASVSSTTTDEPATTIPPTTITVTPTPTPSADCAFWNEGWGRSYEIYNIVAWVDGRGKALHGELSGCGALTGWDWREATDDSYAKVYFNLPYTMKDGCVVRAIRSAGGPKVVCEGQGWG